MPASPSRRTETQHRLMHALELMAYGQSKAGACKAAGIDPATFWRRVKSDVEFAGFYAQARQAGRSAAAGRLLTRRIQADIPSPKWVAPMLAELSLHADTSRKLGIALGLIEVGKSVTSACQEADIHPSTFWRTVKRSKEFAERYCEALQIGYDTLADLLLEIDIHPVYGQLDHKAKKLLCDNIKWLLARRSPKRYGNKVAVKAEEEEEDRGKVITDILERARLRALHRSPSPDAEPIKTAADRPGRGHSASAEE